MQKNRSNRPKKDLPAMQGYKDYQTGEVHAPLNNHQPRVGIAKWHRQRKCHCKESCGGSKNIAMAEKQIKKEKQGKWEIED
jgi:hypothetical protein